MSIAHYLGVEYHENKKTNKNLDNQVIKLERVINQTYLYILQTCLYFLKKLPEVTVHKLYSTYKAKKKKGLP